MLVICGPFLRDCLRVQGNDRGTQYRSGLYYFDDEQKALVESSKDAYEKALKAAGKGSGDAITTEIADAREWAAAGGQCFYYGEDDHQQYLAKPGARPYCSAQPQVVALPPFEEWMPAELHAAHAPKLTQSFWDQHAPTPHCVIRSPDAPIQWIG